MIVQIIRFKCGLSEKAVQDVLAEQRASYRDIPGLVQQVFMRDPATGEYGEISLWDDRKTRPDRRAPDPESIAARCGAEGDPRVDSFEVLSIL